MGTIKIGIVGCGKISSVYMRNLRHLPHVQLYACADLDMDRAKAQAKEFDIPRVCAVQELLDDPDIGIVVNLTIPRAHAEICLRALEAGKHVYAEKPLAVTTEEAGRILALASARGLRVGCAPDTVLGAGIQTARKLIDEGWIGEPVAVSAFMMHGGPEDRHPNPEFVYEVGGGPMFDMGPYYLTAFVHLFGPLRRVTGSAKATFPERMILSQPKYGKMMKVETPTHIAGVLDFRSGVTGTLVTSFDVKGGHDLPSIEVFGTRGSMMVPDPNLFGDPVFLRDRKTNAWREIPHAFGYADNTRGLGVADMAQAIIEGRAHRTDGAVGYHVLEAMHGFHIAAAEGAHYELRSTCSRPDAMPVQP